MPILRNIERLFTCPAGAAPDYVGEIRNAAIRWSGDTITWVGAERELSVAGDEATINAEGRMVVPGLVDCHTHLAFGGWRFDEFPRRSHGTSYSEIAAAGGGIHRTVADTRAAVEQGLIARCSEFLRESAACGVTTVECKSGYGLDTESEIGLLRTYERLDALSATRIIPTLLGAHVPPMEIAAPDDHVEFVVSEMLPRVAGQNIACFCDVFVEHGAFNVDQARRVLQAARQFGIRAKLHADQLSDGGGAALAAELDATSADHLEHASHAGLCAMRDRAVTAVLLPIASLYLQNGFANGRQMVDLGLTVAVATDFNPGTAPSNSLALAMLLACTANRLSPEETLRGVTINAAMALDRQAAIGSIEVGKQADFAIVEAESLNEWIYRLSPTRSVRRFIAGREA